jgi:hypothetical protein
MGLRLIRSDRSLLTFGKSTTDSDPTSPAGSYTSEPWARKMHALRLKNPHLAKLIEDMTDNFLEKGITAAEARNPPPKGMIR